MGRPGRRHIRFVKNAFVGFPGKPRYPVIVVERCGYGNGVAVDAIGNGVARGRYKPQSAVGHGKGKLKILIAVDVPGHFTHEKVFNRPFEYNAVAGLKGLENDFVVVNVGLDLFPAGRIGERPFNGNGLKVIVVADGPFLPCVNGALRGQAYDHESALPRAAAGVKKDVVDI